MKLKWIHVALILFLLILGGMYYEGGLEQSLYQFPAKAEIGEVKIPCYPYSDCYREMIDAGLTEAQIEELGLRCEGETYRCYIKGETSEARVFE